MEATTSALTSTLQHKLPKIKNNVSSLERILMIASGSYLLYKGLSEQQKSIPKITSAGAMLARGITGYCPVYDAIDHIKNDKAQNVNIRVKSMINRPVEEVYAFWRNLENLPKFMNHLQSVKTVNSTLSDWTAKGPAGIGSLSWTSEIVKEEENKILSWQSLPNASIKNVGKVLFNRYGNQTEIDAIISYHAPLGIAGEAAAKLLNPFFEKMVNDDISNLKSYLESVQ
ncbi:MAG: DUF2892 domain-containing protein [Flavobacterium sp.]|nr:MAG: DUF2892 domain-containing protein [Flavobacterium sp.]